MSQSHNLKALQSAQEALTKLEQGFGVFRSSERFWRSWERSRDFVAASRKAQSYLELALEALEEPARQSDSSERNGWLGRTVKGLAQYLSQGGSEEEEEDDSSDQEPIAPEDLSIQSKLAGSNQGQALEGNGAVVELPDLIGMIRGQGMTGVLSLTLPKEVVLLHFDRGQLVHAYSENAPKSLRLGEVLVAQGAVTQERLKSLLYCHQSSPQMLGEILLNGGLVSPEHLAKALNYQIQCLFDRLFTHRRQAHFRFEPGLPNTTAQRAQVNVLQLLLESARSYDERQAG